MAVNDPTMAVPTPTGALQGVAASSWDGSAWQPAGRTGPSLATPTGVLQGIAPFTWDGAAWQPSGRAGPGVATPSGVLDGVAVYTWSGSAWVPAGGQPSPSTPSGALRGVAAFNWDGAAWQPAGQAGPGVATPYGVLQGVAMFSWTGSAWIAAPSPSLDLSFMAPGLLPSGVVFTRASTATYFDAAGVMQTATANTPRWDYNPQTLVLNGLLIEEARTNQAFPSEVFTGWSQTAVTLTANAGTTPTGTNTMTRLAETSATSLHLIQTAVVQTTSVPYTASVFARAAEDRYLQIYYDDNANGAFVTFDLQTGTISQAATLRGTGTSASATIQAVNPAGTYRCALTVTIPNTATRLGFMLSNSPTPGFAPSYPGNTANGLAIWGIHLEAGAFPTSYIPTTAAAATRSIEVATLPTTGWINATAGTLMLEQLLPLPATVNNAHEMGSLNDGTGQNRLALQRGNLSNTIAGFIALGGVTQYFANTGVMVAGSPVKAAMSYVAGTQRTAVNGAVLAGVGASALPGMTTLLLGSIVNVNVINGYLRRVRYWPRALTTAELQSVTT